MFTIHVSTVQTFPSKKKKIKFQNFGPRLDRDNYIPNSQLLFWKLVHAVNLPEITLPRIYKLLIEGPFNYLFIKEIHSPFINV